MSIAVAITAATLCAAAIVVLGLAAFVSDEVTTARREAGAFVTALLLFALFYLTFFFRDLLGSNYLAPGDSLDFGVADYLASPALWTQGMWSGYPIAADPQSLTWYPLLHLFRSVDASWNVFLISAYVMTSATTFLFVRRLTRSTLAGAFSGFVCGFSGMMLGYIGNFNQIHAFSWVPLTLYGLQLIREDSRRPGAAVTAIAAALMWLAGHPQIPVYAMYLALLVVCGGVLVDRLRPSAAIERIAWSGSALTLGLVLAAVALIPAIELSGFSPRSSSNWDLYVSSALQPRELLTLMVPFAFGGFWTAAGEIPYLGNSGDSGYVGLIPLALALAAPCVLLRQRREARVWIFAGFLEALLCLGPATPVGTLFFYAPGYQSFQAPLRHLFFVGLCIAVAAGLAFAELTVQRERRGRIGTAALGVTVAAAIAFAVFAWRTTDVRALLAANSSYQQFAVGWPLLVAGCAVLLAVAGRRLPGRRAGVIAFSMLLVVIQIGDLAMIHYRLPGRRFRYADIRSSETVLHPKMAALQSELAAHGERMLGTDGSRNQFLLPNLTRAWRIPAASGTGSLPISRYIEMLGMSGSGTVPGETLSTAHRGIDLFAIRYALVRQDWDVANDLKQQPDHWQAVEDVHYYEDDPDTHYTLFRNVRPLPHAWCAAQAMKVSPSDALTTIRTGRLPDGAEFDFSRSVLYDAGELADWQPGIGAAATDPLVTRVGYNRYRVNSAAPCVLITSEVYYPWWRARIDGQRVGPVRVNYAMLGLAVPAGAHDVELSIEPVSVWVGGAISGAGILLWLALVFGPRRHAVGDRG